jgi:hypothetical protein
MERCCREVNQLHHFFQEWFRGTLAQDEVEFSRFSGVLADAFAMVGPNGRLYLREAILDRVWYGHGRWLGDGRIWVQNCQLQWQRQEVRLVTYEEWQVQGGRTQARISSALLAPNEAAPNGLTWLHVHETWLPQP